MYNKNEYRVMPYTADEIEFNRQLLEACEMRIVNLKAVESLLKKGADPLGTTNPDYIDKHLYSDIVCTLGDFNSKYLPKVTELFLKYGMNIDRPRVPYDDRTDNPLWVFAFFSGHNVARTLKTLLDHGLSAKSTSVFWNHEIGDLIDVYYDDIHEEFMYNRCMWTIKKLMLLASYDHILKNDEQLRRFIGYDYNSYDIKHFRNWDDFEYIFDTTHCNGTPQLDRSIVRIHEKKTKREVWVFGVYLDWMDNCTVRYVRRNKRDLDSPFVCPICGKHTFKKNGDVSKCPVCLWQNDIVQNCEPSYKNGANKMSQNKYRKNYLAGEVE